MSQSETLDGHAPRKRVDHIPITGITFLSPTRTAPLMIRVGINYEIQS